MFVKKLDEFTKMLLWVLLNVENYGLVWDFNGHKLCYESIVYPGLMGLGGIFACFSLHCGGLSFAFYFSFGQSIPNDDLCIILEFVCYVCFELFVVGSDS